MEALIYGDDPQQKAELHRPASRSRGVVVVVHGGFWRARYDFSLGRPLAASLARRGWTAVNLEYRRVGNGGGYPRTLDDVAAGIDHLADVPDLDTSTVVTLGHSAGGHLAVWAAGRRSPRVRVTAAVAQAGVLDLRTAVERDLGAGAVRDLLGEHADDTVALDAADPMARVPLDVPVWCVHSPGDESVPIEQSQAYVRRARAAGARAGLVTVDGDHSVHLDVSSEAWVRTTELLEDL